MLWRRLNMHLESHEVFRAAVEYGSVTKAAQALHMTQSTASRHLQALEDEYGGILFSRSASGVTLTEMGRALYPYTCDLLSCQARAKEELRHLSRVAQHIGIGATLTIGEYVLPQILGAFRQSHPQAGVRMRIANTREILADLMRHRIDAAIVEGLVETDPEIRVTPWLQDEIILVCGPQHPFSRRSQILLTDLPGESLLTREVGSGTRQVTELALESHGILGDLRFALELGSTQAIKSAIECNLGCAFLSRLTVRSELASGRLCAVPVRDLAITRTLAILERTDKYPRRLINEFLEMVRNWS